MNSKTAILTGISSDIGQAIAKALSAQGWRIIGLYHKTKPTIADEFYQIDLGDPAATKTIAEKLAKDLPQLDALIHVAGIWHDKDSVLADKKLSDFTPGQIISTMNVGITSLMLLCNRLLPIMKDGTVIGISGTFSDVSGGAAGWLPYYTSKRALEDFLVGLSQDMPAIKVFGISPSDTATTPYEKFYPEYAKDAQSPDVIADLVVKLISDDNEFKSGEIIEVREGKAKEGYHV